MPDNLRDLSFLAVEADRLPAFAEARSALLGLPFPAAHLNGVVENLATLQAHARILAAHMAAASPKTAS